MNSRAMCLALVGLILIAIAACNRTTYSGDGVLTDRGASAATNRYELDLGVIDLNRSNTYHYDFRGLPPEHFVVGIVITSEAFTKEEYVDAKPVTSKVTLSLKDQERSVIKVESRLDEMTWSHGLHTSVVFIYRRDGNSTYFQSSPAQTYTLDLTVSVPSIQGTESKAKLVAYAGGWK